MSTNLPSEEYANIPKSLSHLRACKRCYLIKEYEDFLDYGCDNCEAFLNMANSEEKVNECTSAYFDGYAADSDKPFYSFVGMFNNKHSWVAVNQRINNLKSGMYAVQVTGNFPEEIQDSLREQQVFFPKNLEE